MPELPKTSLRNRLSLLHPSLLPLSPLSRPKQRWCPCCCPMCPSPWACPGQTRCQAIQNSRSPYYPFPSSLQGLPCQTIVDTLQIHHARYETHSTQADVTANITTIHRHSPVAPDAPTLPAVSYAVSPCCCWSCHCCPCCPICCCHPLLSSMLATIYLSRDRLPPTPPNVIYHPSDMDAALIHHTITTSDVTRVLNYHHCSLRRE